MNRVQQIALSITSILLILLLLFPPFLFKSERVSINLGYGFLFNPPLFEEEIKGLVNVNLLAVELAVVFIVGVFIAIIFNEAKNH